MIIRDPRPSDTFALIHTAALADGRLSFKARGILALLLAQPAGALSTVERLAKSGSDGERAVKSGLKELEEHGYLIRDPEGDTPTLRVTDTPDAPAEPVPVPVVPAAELAGVEAPTPQHTGWQPTPAAIHTAEQTVKILDIPVNIAIYRVRVKELGREPTSGEWLRWLLKDEEKALIEERRKQQESTTTSKWWSTASD